MKDKVRWVGRRERREDGLSLPNDHIVIKVATSSHCHDRFNISVTAAASQITKHELDASLESFMHSWTML